MSIQQSINQAASIGAALYTYNKEKKEKKAENQKEKPSTSSVFEQKQPEANRVSNIKSKIENMMMEAAERSNAKYAYKAKVAKHSLLAAKKSKTRYEKFINIEGEKNG